MEQDENREITIYKKFEQLDSSHPGRRYVRTMLDSFQIQGPQGYHQCLVHRPLWQSMFSLQHRNPRHRFTEQLLRAMLLHLFVALDYVHSSCHLIHTGTPFLAKLCYIPRLWIVNRHLDIKASNILSEIEDESILTAFEAAEAESPSAKVIRPDRTIYASRKLGLPKIFGPPILCDFGVACFGDEVNNENIQPEVYRAPEVILGMNWSYPVDIWNVGVMVYPQT